MPTTSTPPDDFLSRLERVRASGMLRIDLAASDPGRCGLGWKDRELEALLDARHSSAIDSRSPIPW